MAQHGRTGATPAHGPAPEVLVATADGVGHGNHHRESDGAYTGMDILADTVRADR